MDQTQGFSNSSSVSNIAEAIAHTAASSDRGIRFVTGQSTSRKSWGQLHEEAKLVAARLQAEHDISSGNHVALLGPTSPDLVLALQSIWLAGATLVVLPMPMRLSSIEDFVVATKKRITEADCKLVIIDDSLMGFVTAEADSKSATSFTSLQSLVAGDGSDQADYVRPSVDSNDLLALQFTSGSTSAPKGVMLSNRVVAANIDAIAEASGLSVENDVMVSWLPLYHDMGLIGFCTFPMVMGVELVLGGPQDFLSAPAKWMQWISEYGGTATAGPNFSYALAARALKRSEDVLDLSKLRIALNGAEPVDPNTVRDFNESGARHGLKPEAIFPAFGMAEVAIAGSFPKPMSGLNVDIIDSEKLENENLAQNVSADAKNAKEVVLLGWPVPGLEFRVVDPESGTELSDRQVGELQISGTSVSPGYYRDPEANAVAFDDEWFKTGDLAYLVQGQLALCGRIKDLIIVGGRNIYPQDIEREVGEIEGVRTCNVVAFGVGGRGGKEKIVVVVETRSDNYDELTSQIKQATLDAVGAPCHDVVFVEVRSLPKTSSGKLQRDATRKLYESNSLQTVSG